MTVFTDKVRSPGVAGLALLLALPSLEAQAIPRVADFEPPAAPTADFDLTIGNIMKGPELVGQAPEEVSWSDDARWIYFRWLPGGQDWHAERELYRVPAEGGEPERLSEEAADSLAPLVSEGDVSPDGRRRVTSVRGDLWLVDRSTLDTRRLTRTRATEETPLFSSDGRRVFFVRDGDLFALDLEDGGVRQLTDIRRGPEPEEEGEAEGQDGFLERQQKELFEHIRIQKRKDEEEEAREERRREEGPTPVHLGEDEHVVALRPNRQGTRVVVSTSVPPKGADTVDVPDWVTESGYTEDLRTRPKVGDEQSMPGVSILNVPEGELTRLHLAPDSDDAGRAGSLFAASFVAWNEAGTRALLLSVSEDYKTRWYWSLDARTGDLTLLDELRDEAWVGGPCFRGVVFGRSTCAGWIPGRDRAYFVSEETGWAHLYSVAADGTDRRQLTSGEWEVRDVGIPEDGGRFHLTASRESPFDEHFYVMDFDGSDLVRITAGEGHFDVTPSPDGERLAVIRARSNRPPELFVAPFEQDPEMDQVTVSPTADWLTFPWIRPEIVRFRAEDGTMVPARIYRPSDVGGTPHGAAVLFVHGAGYLQNVHHGWSGYYREYMFHHFLASLGYTVLDVDYRGSAGYGRDWRTSVYRWMGGADLSDQVDGARYLVEEEGIDPDRIGIYGGSYGGFITLMALFTADDTFRAGAALRSVSDWAHYNHWYTSRILNLPQDDPEAYERSSPIYFAENFGPDQHLLILHGMVDTNVHFSDVVRLAQRLIELGKEDWEFAVFPVEDHGFTTPSSWTDEYRRIFELFDRTIGEGLAVEAPPAALTEAGGGL